MRTIFESAASDPERLEIRHCTRSHLMIKRVDASVQKLTPPPPQHPKLADVSLPISMTRSTSRVIARKLLSHHNILGDWINCTEHAPLSPTLRLVQQ